MDNCKRFIQLCPFLALFYALSGLLANGTFNNPCDYQVASGEQLRIIRNGPYTVGIIDYRWACDLRLVSMQLSGLLSENIAENNRQGGGACTSKCDELHQVGQQVLIGENYFYSSDGGRTFVDPTQLTRHLPDAQFDQRFSLSDNAVIVHTWSSFVSKHDEPPESSYTSSDGGRTWKRLR